MIFHEEKLKSRSEWTLTAVAKFLALKKFCFTNFIEFLKVFMELLTYEKHMTKNWELLWPTKKSEI